MERTLSAPGKLFVSGEYAVLWGGHARILAVAPRVSALMRARQDRRVDVVLEDGRLTGQATPAGVRWDTPVDARFHFVARTIDLAYRLVGLEGPGFSVAFESSPTSGGHKLGLGSSARATVLAAEASRAALQSDFDALKLSLLAHADAQGGKGSGGDVAASFAGGLVRYRRYDVGPMLEAVAHGGLAAAVVQSPPVELLRVAQPALPMLFAFSGESASTTSLVKDVERRLSAEQRAKFVADSDALGLDLEDGVARADFAKAREASRALQELLFGLGPTRSPALERILLLAETMGCTGKQSGAGGGDGCILFAPDAKARAALIETLTSRGVLAFAVGAEPGLRGEVLRPPRLAEWLDALP